MKRFGWLATLLASGAVTLAQDNAPKPDDLFKQLDKNNDGKIVKDEVPQDQARFFERLVRLGDADKNGELSLDEFKKASSEEAARPAGPPQDGRGFAFDPKQMFQRMDRNSDGKLTKDELPEFLQERAGRVFEELKKDALTFDDFEKVRERFMGPAGGGPGGPGGRFPMPSAEDAFKRMDQNSDGKLTKDELPEFLRDRMGKVFEELKKDSLTLEEFKTARDRLMAQAPEGGRPGGGFAGGSPEDMFKRFDENGDGKLKLDEVPEGVRRFLTPLFERLGKGKDGEITKDEFVKASEEFRRGREGAPGAGRPEGQRPDGARPEGERRPDAARRPESDRPMPPPPPGGREGERRPEGDQPMPPREGDRRPEGDRPMPPREGDRRPEGGQRPMLPRLFQLLDSDKNGRVSKAELEKAASLFKELDENGDGELEPRELLGPPPGMGQFGGPGPDGGRGRPEGGRPNGDRPAPPEGGNRRPESDRPRPEGDRPRPEGDRPRPEGEPRGDELFKRLDRNNDGKITKEEAPERLKENFDRVDANKDGAVDKEELSKLLNQTQPRRRQD